MASNQNVDVNQIFIIGAPSVKTSRYHRYPLLKIMIVITDQCINPTQTMARGWIPRYDISLSCLKNVYINSPANMPIINKSHILCKYLPSTTSMFVNTLV